VKRDVDVVLRELFLRFYAREITASDRTLCQNFLGDNPDAEDWRRLIATLFNSKELNICLLIPFAVDASCSWGLAALEGWL